jgi:hypothetical protein
VNTVIVGAALGAAAIVLTACTATDPPAPTAKATPPAGQLQPRCPPPGRPGIADATAVNKLVAATDLPAWQAADIGASVRLSDGRIVWMFGDTLRNQPASPPIVANSMLISSGQCISQFVPAGRGAVLPDPGPSKVFWPMSATALRLKPGTDDLIVLCSRIRRGSKPYDFTFLGTSAAVFRVGPLGVPQLLRIDEITPDDTRLTQVNWGAATVVQGNWLYVYGTRLTGQKLSFGRELHVARVPTVNPQNRKTWQFWDGHRWQADVDASAAVLPAAGGVSQTLSVDVVGKEFLAVSKRDGDLGDFVYTWTSAGPTGPWTPKRALRAPAGFDTGVLQYAPLAHPEVPLDSGQLLVSISRNTTDLGELLAAPALGRPRFAQVPLPSS